GSDIVDDSQGFAAANLKSDVGNGNPSIVDNRSREMGRGREAQIEDNLVVGLVTAGRISIHRHILNVRRLGMRIEPFLGPPGEAQPVGLPEDLEAPYVTPDHGTRAFDGEWHVVKRVTPFTIGSGFGNSFVGRPPRCQVDTRAGYRLAGEVHSSACHG